MLEGLIQKVNHSGPYRDHALIVNRSFHEEIRQEGVFVLHIELFLLVRRFQAILEYGDQETRHQVFQLFIDLLRVQRHQCGHEGEHLDNEGLEFSLEIFLLLKLPGTPRESCLVEGNRLQIEWQIVHQNLEALGKDRFNIGL